MTAMAAKLSAPNAMPSLNDARPGAAGLTGSPATRHPREHALQLHRGLTHVELRLDLPAPLAAHPRAQLGVAGEGEDGIAEQVSAAGRQHVAADPVLDEFRDARD